MGTADGYSTSVVGMRSVHGSIRFAWASLFALLLAVRSLAPAGFMPAFDHGAVTIVACPDAVVAPSRHHHHPGDHKAHHQPCPYASMSSLVTPGVDFAPLVATVLIAVTLLLGRLFLFVDKHTLRERPPAIGPPSLA